MCRLCSKNSVSLADCSILHMGHKRAWRVPIQETDPSSRQAGGTQAAFANCSIAPCTHVATCNCRLYLRPCLRPKQMHLLDENKLERRTLARNELLFRQGDKVRAIYFIEEGRLRLDRRTFDGRSLGFGTSSAAGFFVEAALFAEIFHCDAVATEPSRVRVYPKAAVLKALETQPSGAVPFLKLIARQLIETRQCLELMKIRSAKERVLLYLDLHAGT